MQQYLSGYPNPYKSRRGRFGAFVARAVVRPLRAAWSTTRIRILSPYWARKAARLYNGRATPKLHLGCGSKYLDGWTNIDLSRSKVDLHWDLRRGIPFPDNSCCAVFHEHLLEHFYLDEAAVFIRECHRVLRPGGILRVVVPDAGAYLRAYAEGGDGIISEVRPGRPTPLIAVQEVFYWYGHRSAYDAETLVAVCRFSGFESAKQGEFGTSRLEPCPDSEDRRTESLYVEAVKAG